MVKGRAQISDVIHYCSYFDHRYLARALCLYESLREHSPPFRWHVLALSKACEQVLTEMNLPGIEVISLETLESAMPELLVAKGNRSIVEYYFTLTSAFCLHLLPKIPHNEWLTYLDSDLYFFKSPQTIFDELEGASVGIIEHRFTAANQPMIKHGRFNVGWVSFRRDEAGRCCLADWTQKCLEWCYDRLDGDRFADQKYLDRWPEAFADVRVIQQPGVNVGPWNVADYAREWNLQSGPVKTGLVFAHYQGVRYLGHRTYEIAMDAYHIDLELRKMVLQTFYRPYLLKLYASQKRLAKQLSLSMLRSDQELRSPKSLLPLSSFRELVRFPKQYYYMVRRRCWVTIW